MSLARLWMISSVTRLVLSRTQRVEPLVAISKSERCTHKYLYSFFQKLAVLTFSASSSLHTFYIPETAVRNQYQFAHSRSDDELHTALARVPSLLRFQKSNIFPTIGWPLGPGGSLYFPHELNRLSMGETNSQAAATISSKPTITRMSSIPTVFVFLVPKNRAKKVVNEKSSAKEAEQTNNDKRTGPVKP